MKQFYKYIIGISLLISGIVAFSAYAQKVATDYIVSPKEKEEKMKSDSTELRFPIKKEVVTYDDFKQKTPADLEDPSNVTKDVIYTAQFIPTPVTSSTPTNPGCGEATIASILALALMVSLMVPLFTKKYNV